ncbi:unnamed protein product, partial [Scytosiphon promiscuus]
GPDGADDNLHGLDVDKIIESMELEAGEGDDDLAHGGVRAGGNGTGLSGSGMPSWRTSAAAAGGAGTVSTRTAAAAAAASSPRSRSFTTDGNGGAGAGAAEAGQRDRRGSVSGGAASPLSSAARKTLLGADGGGGGGVAATSRDNNGEPSSMGRKRLSQAGIISAGGAFLPGVVGGGDFTKGPPAGGELGLTGALRKAEAEELRLLRGGNREMISPLQVKRRMRAPPPPPPAAGQPSTGFPGIGGGVGGGVGVVRMENLDAASRQLARNAAYGKHGPGVCTALAAHSKFIAVGTSRGLILLFDHFQEIRHVLGSAGAGGVDGTPGDDPVTSLDMFVGSDYLVAGHGSGRVLLWDYLRGVILKAVIDAHSSPVVSVSSDPAAITADVEGVVNKMCFRRVMWTKWVVDTECLLDGAAGPIPALCVLPTWTDSSTSSPFSSLAAGGGGSRSSAVAGLSPGFHDLGMMSMSSWKNTFIVGIYPESFASVYYSCLPPLALPCYAPTCLAPRLAPLTELSTRKTGEGHPQPSAARAGAPPMALLARGWGNSIQILAATRVDVGDAGGGGGAGGAGAGKKGVRWPGLAVVKELSASAPVVAVEWLREQICLSWGGAYRGVYACPCTDLLVNLVCDRERICLDGARILSMDLTGSPVSLSDNPKKVSGTCFVFFRPPSNFMMIHFQMLAGVCAEFCAVTGRLDMLFGQIFQAFRARGQQGVFLDTLEPYVLMGKLRTLSPEVTSAFVDRCQSGGDMVAAERLVLRLEPRSLDLTSTLPLLRRHRLHTALLAVRASTGDYISSVEEVLREVMSIAERDQQHGAPLSPRSDTGGDEREEGETRRRQQQQQQQLSPYPADPSFDELGYKVLLYLKRCFRGRVLGAAEPLSAADAAKARASLLRLLVRSHLSSSGTAGTVGASAVTDRGAGSRGGARAASGWGGEPGGGGGGTSRGRSRHRWQEAFFPYLSVLLYVDAGATIDVLSVAMDSPDAIFQRESTPAATETAAATAAARDGSGLAFPVAGAGPPAFNRESSSSSSSLSFAASADGSAWGGGAGAESRGGPVDSGGAPGGSSGGVWGRRLGRRGRAARAIGRATGGPGAGAGVA